MMTIERRVLLASGVALVSLLGWDGIHGYSANGPTWPTNQVSYYINASNNDVSESAARAAVQAGAIAWTAQSATAFQFQYEGPTSTTNASYDGQNNVVFRNASSGSAVATTYYWSSTSSGNLLDADIVFWDGAYAFFTGTSGCTYGAYIEDIATHEFGHALGLGHSGSSAATMYPTYSSCSTTMRTLSADDVNGVESLYPPSGTTQPPSSPSNLSAVTSAANPEAQINVTWNDTSNDEDWFTIERASDGANFVQVGQNSANDTSYSDSSLSSGSTYWYRVRAVNSGGESAPSNIDSASTAEPPPDPEPEPDPPVDPPSSPTGPDPADGATHVDRDADLAWTGDPDADSYDVYFGQSDQPGLYKSGVASPGLSLPKLGKNRTYYWRVVARNSAGDASSLVWWFSTGAGPGGSTNDDGGGGTPSGGNGRGRGKKK